MKISFKKGWHRKIDEQRRAQYKAGRTYEVTQAIADEAAKAGVLAAEGKADTAKAG